MKRLMKACGLAVMLGSSLGWAADAPAEAAPAANKAERPTLEVVFVLDTTSSMGGLIEGAKQKIWSIASRMASGKPTPRIRIGLVAFRDQGDDYVTKRFDLTEDLDSVYKNLNGLNAGGGGDTPEHVGRGLGEAVKLMSWSDNTKAAKMIFVVGDAPSHEYQDGWSAKTWAHNAIAKGIVVNTIRCGTDATTETEFRELAKLADGTYTSIGQAGGMVAVATPYDADIGKLNGALASTSLVGGGKAVREEAEKELKAVAAMPAPAAADRVAYHSAMGPGKGSGSGAYGTGAGAAVELAEEPSRLNELSADDMPDVLRAMKPAERAAYVTKTAAERKALQAQLTELAKKRESWLSENAKKAESADSFDNKVFSSVKARAAKVGVSY